MTCWWFLAQSKQRQETGGLKPLYTILPTEALRGNRNAETIGEHATVLLRDAPPMQPAYTPRPPPSSSPGTYTIRHYRLYEYIMMENVN